MCSTIAQLTCPVAKLTARKISHTVIRSSLYTSFIIFKEHTLPDDLHICVQAVQILAAACHHWRNAGTPQTVLQPCLRLRSPRGRPVETSWSISGWLCYQNTVRTHGDITTSTLETAASLSGPFSGVGMDLEKMQFFTVRTKLPSTSSNGNASAERGQNDGDPFIACIDLPVTTLWIQFYLWALCRTRWIGPDPAWGLKHSRSTWIWWRLVTFFCHDRGSHGQYFGRSRGRVQVWHWLLLPQQRLTLCVRWTSLQMYQACILILYSVYVLFICYYWCINMKPPYILLKCIIS